MSWGTVGQINESTLGWHYIGSGTAVSSNELVVAGEATDDELALGRFKTDGTEVWSQKDIEGVINGSFGTPQYSEEAGIVYLPYAINDLWVGIYDASTGEKITRTDSIGYDTYQSSPDKGVTFPNGNLLTEDPSDSELIEVSTDGNVVRTVNLGDGASSFDYVEENDTVYVSAGSGGTIYRFNRLMGLENSVTLDSDMSNSWVEYIGGTVYVVAGDNPNASVDNSFYKMNADLSEPAAAQPERDISSAEAVKDKLYASIEGEGTFELSLQDGSAISQSSTSTLGNMQSFEGSSGYYIASSNYNSVSLIDTSINVGFEIGGQMVDIDGSGIGEGTVTVKGTDNSSEVADTGGYAVFEKDGQYTLVAEAQGYFTKEKAVSVSGSSVEKNFVLNRANLSGQVRDVTGTDVDSVEVVLDDGSGNTSTTSPVNGQYSFEGSLEKNTTYTVSINDSSGGYFEDSYEVEVTNREISGVDFALDTFSEFEFDLTDRETGGKVNGTPVNVLEEDREQASANSNASGIATVKSGTRFDGPVNVILGGGDNRYITRRVQIDPDNGDVSTSLTMTRKTNIGNAV